MYIIFPAAEAAAMLQVDIAEYRRKFGNPVIETSPRAGREITEDECLQIVYGMADDAMNAHLLWVPQSTDCPQMNAAVRALFPQWQTDGHEVPSDHLFREVLDQAMIEVHRWIDLLMVKPSWHVWSIRRLGSDIMLEKGEDYRVLDWNRRMESGEWSDPAYKAAAVRQQDDDARTEESVSQQTSATMRSVAEHLLQMFGRPGLRHLDQETLDFLRKKFAALTPNQERQVIFRDQRMPRLKTQLPCGSVVIYNPDAVDETAANETPKTLVDEIIEDSPTQRKKRRGSNG